MPSTKYREISDSWSRRREGDRDAQCAQKKAIPFETDSRVLFFNKTLFAEAGILQPPTTWDELDLVAKKLTRTGPDGKYTQVGLIPWYSQGSLYLWGWSAGGDFFNPQTGRFTLTDSNLVRALQWMTDWAQRYNKPALDAFTGSGNFTNQKLAMMISGPWELANLNRAGVEFGIAPPPYPQGGHKVPGANSKEEGRPRGRPSPC